MRLESEGNSDKRAAIPARVERDVLLEAGHRCAIPTCRQVPVEIAHIEPWHRVRKHEFQNLIALCPTCHTRYDGGEIDRLSMHRYKANLTILSVRYGDLERRVLEYFVDHPSENQLPLFGAFDLQLANLIKDGLLEDTGHEGGCGLGGDYGVIWSEKLYRLTDAGRAFVAKWVAAEKLA